MNSKKKQFIVVLILINLFFINCKHTNESNSNPVIKIDTMLVQDKITQTIEKTTLNESKDECVKNTLFSLPYDNKIDVKNINYNKLQCEIIGINSFLCDEENIRYISMPDYKKVKIILVPQDCGDFNYRFFLLTIFNNKLVSNQYVEGEWYEPGDDSYKEITNFTLDKNYIITITTTSIESGKSSMKEKLVFQINDNGILKRI